MHQLNNKWLSAWLKGFAKGVWVDEGALISFSQYSNSSFSHVHAS